MNIKKFALSSVVLTSSLLSACASNLPKAPDISNESAPYIESMSYGKNILLAGGMRAGTINEMKDAEVSPQDFAKLKAESSMLRSGANAAALSGLAIALDMGTINGNAILGSVDFKSMVGMGLINGLLKPDHPSLVEHLVMWMPKDLAPTEDAMKEKINDIFREAHLKSVPEGFELAENKENRHERYTVKGGICSKTYAGINVPTCAGSLERPIFTTEMPDFMQAFLVAKYQSGFRPTFFENPGDPAWVGYLRGGISEDGYQCYLFDKDERSEQDRQACASFNKNYMENLKTNLPDWVYLYHFDKEKGIGMVEQMGKVRNIFPLIMPKKS